MSRKVVEAAEQARRLEFENWPNNGRLIEALAEYDSLINAIPNEEGK